MISDSFGLFIGIGTGFALGIIAGTKFLVDYFAQVDLKHLDIRSDYDDNVAVPDNGDNPVPSKYRSFIPYFPNWVTLPDYYRATWMNHILKTLWPQYNQAIGKMVLDTAKPYTDDIVKQYPFVKCIDVEIIDFGTKPVRIGGIKVFNSSDDEVIMECAMYWGSNAKVRVSARLQLWKFSFYIPVQISDPQMKATARITLRPLVDTLPCMGAVTMSLIEDPYFDFCLYAFRPFDWMLLPGLSQLVTWTIKGVIGDLMQYPNSMTFDIMEGGGVAPPPIGLLQVKILNVDKITSGGDLLSKVDPYVEVGVRERTQRTRTVWNNKNPDFQEVFNLIVDDPDLQSLSFKLHDDDLGFNDPVIGVCEHPLSDANFIKKPKQRAKLDLHFIKPAAHNKAKRLVQKSSSKREENGQKPDLKETGEVDGQGRKQYKIPDQPSKADMQDAHQMKHEHSVGELHCEVMYVPFENASTHSSAKKPEDDSDEYENHQNNQASKTHQSLISLNHITDETKGILTVTLTGCKNLEASDGSVEPYVLFRLEDPTKVKPEIQKSTSMTREPNPHWNQKFDFAMCAATSVLQLHVYDKKTNTQNLLHSVGHPIETVGHKISGWKKVYFANGQAQITPNNPHYLETSHGSKDVRDEKIGSLRLKVKDVVRNERIRDSWALQQTQKGDIQLTLDWIPVSLTSLDEELDDPGDQNEIKAMRKKQEQEEKRRDSVGRMSVMREKLHLRHNKGKDGDPDGPSSSAPSVADGAAPPPQQVEGRVKNSADHEKKGLHLPNPFKKKFNDRDPEDERLDR